MNEEYINTKLPEKDCPICEINNIESYLIASRYRSYSCPNCGYFAITYMAYKYTPIINDPVTKQKISYYVRTHSDIENPISLKQGEISAIVENTKLPSVIEQMEIILDWICTMSKSTLDTIDGNTKHLIALLGCKNQSQVIHVLDEIWKLGYIEMENPTASPLRDRPVFDLFSCHLTSKGLESIQKSKSKNIKFNILTENDIEQLLTNNESTNLEVKGSCQLDLNRLLKGDEKKISSIIVAKEGVLKTIVAFLNSRGGMIVIGALEKDKYSVEQMSKIPFSEYGNYYLIGVNIENESIDKYELNLRKYIETHISKSVVGLLDITFPQIDGFTLCQISVGNAEHKWYYLDDEKFYVRDGNRTVVRQANDADEYKKRNPR